MKKLVTMRMDDTLLHRLDSHISKFGVDRTSLIISLIESHLQLVEGRPIVSTPAPTQFPPFTPERTSNHCVLSDKVSYYKDKKTRTAANMAFPGVVPRNTQVFHTCNQTRCVNPSHLFLGQNNQKPRKWMHMVLAFPREYPQEVLESAKRSSSNLHRMR